MVCFSSEPIEPRQVYGLIEKDAAGSALFHFAVAKALGTTHGMTTHISYEPNGDVKQALNAIAMEMRQKWNLADVLLLRRHGLVAVGEIISLVAVRSPRQRRSICRMPSWSRLHEANDEKRTKPPCTEFQGL